MECFCYLLTLSLFLYGAWFVASAVKFVVSFVYRHKFRAGLSLPDRYGKGTWALVTGATAGIGNEFCLQLARLGFNIVLLSRSPKSLAEAERALKAACPGVSTHTVALDYAGPPTLEQYDSVAAELKRFDISILVNNAGYASIGEFLSVPSRAIKQTLDTNVAPHILLTKALLPQLKSRALNGTRSAVVFVGSIAGQYHRPVHAAYSATKAFLDFFAQAIA